MRVLCGSVLFYNDYNTYFFVTRNRLLNEHKNLSYLFLCHICNVFILIQGSQTVGTTNIISRIIKD